MKLKEDNVIQKQTNQSKETNNSRKINDSIRSGYESDIGNYGARRGLYENAEKQTVGYTLSQADHGGDGKGEKKK